MALTLASFNWKWASRIPCIPKYDQHDYISQGYCLELLGHQQLEIFPVYGSPFGLKLVVVYSQLITNDNPDQHILSLCGMKQMLQGQVHAY